MSDQVKIQATFGWPCLTDKGLRLRYVPHEIVPSPKQAAFLATTCEEALYGGSAGAGKECALTTPVLTTDGWSTFGDLRVGDYVFDHDGEPTMVTWKSPVSLRPESYRVEMTDGETIDCCVDHLWNVATERQRANWRNTNPRWQAQRRAERPQRGRTQVERVGIVDGRAHGTADTISRLNSALAAERREERDRPSRWDYTTTMTTAKVIALQGRERQRVAIPTGGPLRTTGGWLSDCPPYTFGAWLGDGNSRSGYIYVCQNDLAAMTSEIEADGWTVEALVDGRAGELSRTQDFYKLKLTARDGRTLTEILRSEGRLDGKCVPEWVHSAPHADRQAFLGGFCDTDGHVDKGGRVEFCLAREDMVRDVHSLFWSIGESPAGVRRRTTRNQTPGFEGEAWRFSVNRCSTYLFRMPRKRDRLAVPRSRSHDATFHRSIKSITPTEPVPMQCIKVDNPRGLFRVGRSHLVTHNTACALMAALQFADVPGYNALIIRKNLTDLKQLDGLIPVSQQWLTGKGPVYNANDHKWTFPTNGAPATLQFGHMANPGSWFRYQGAQAQMVFFDELTQHPDDVGYTYLFSRMRRITLPREEMIALYGCSDDGLTIADIPLRMRAACVDEGEVLTVAEGWKDIRDVKAGEFVYSMTEDGTLQSKEVTAHHAYDNDKPMVRVEMRNLSMSMTADHRVTHLTLNQRHPERRRYETSHYNEHHGTRIDVARAPRRIEAPGYDGDPLGWGTETYLAYLGLFLAEGCTPPSRNGNYRVVVTQCDPIGADRVASLMEGVPLRWCRTSGGDFQITNKATWEHFRQFGKAHEKHIPREILMTATEGQLRILFDWLVFGDGHVRGSSVSYVTCSSQLADDVAEVGMKLGYRVKITRKELPDPNHRDRYDVYLTRGLSTRVEKAGPRSPVSQMEFTGQVYCLEVADNHNFVLRQRGTVWVSGNTNPGGVGGDWVRKRFVDPDTALAPFLPAFAAENPGIDSDEYARSLARLSEVERRRLQDGDWSVMEIPGALWRFSDIAHPYGPFPSEPGPSGTSVLVPDLPLPEFDYVVVGVDGAVSEGTGDECGIVAVGKTTGGVCAVLEDASLRAHPDDWAKRAVTTYHAHQASRMVIEDNQGGVMNRMIVHNAADVLGVPRPNVILVRAKPGESKEVRAQPVTQAYRAGKVVHGPDLLGSALESQMVSWIPGDKNSISKSPDRVDALVWAIQHALFGAGGAPIRTTTRTRDRMSSWG